MEFSEFAKAVRKLTGPKKHRVKNSYGVYDGYKYYRKNKPAGHEYVLTESQYFSIIRKVNRLLAIALSDGKDISLPCSMGRLEVRKHPVTVKLKDGKIVTNMAIDWNRTVKLWYEDKQAFDNKTLVRIEEKDIYKIYYNRAPANYTNKSFYKFNTGKKLKGMLRDNIRDDKIDAFLI